MKNSCKRILNILQITIKVILIVFVSLMSYTYLNKVFYNHEVDHGESFHTLPNNSMDVIVLGSSHAQYSFIPSVFYEDTGLYSYVLGSACQPLEVSVQMLKEALKTQKPKLVILEGYTTLPMHITSCLADSCYVIAEYQMRGEEKYTTISYLPEEKAESYYNDFYSYHNDWKDLDDWSVLKPSEVFKKKEEMNTSFGYVYSSPKYPITNYWAPNYNDIVVGKLNEEDEKSLNEILAICKDNGIELYLYKVPIDGPSEKDWSTIKALWKWADNNNVKYFDLFSTANMYKYYSQVHSDGSHAYVNGANFVTDSLAERINKLNIDFNHKENEELETIYRQNAQVYTANDMAYEEDPFKILYRLKNSKGYVLLRYIPSMDHSPSDSLKEAIIKAGFTDIDFVDYYYGIIHEGEIVFSGTEELNKIISGKEITLNKNGIKIDNNELVSDGLMTIGFLSENGEKYGFLDVEYREYTWRIGWYNYEDLFWDWRWQ